MTKEKLCKLSLLMTEEYHKPSKTIIRQGQPMSSCYIIASGKVSSDSHKNEVVKVHESGLVTFTYAHLPAGLLHSNCFRSQDLTKCHSNLLPELMFQW